MSGCVMSVLFGRTNANSVRLLNRAGCDVVVPRSRMVKAGTSGGMSNTTLAVASVKATPSREPSGRHR